ncbi:hypothetical protein WJX72_001107 [[Myrmecia] bisecta]|uniref:Protein kinase domain-containing protein n=1 Tax=[Myrmecia] bisecta TaxID=41462 RepID=A0AAW1Q073_9CHLO
MSAHSFTVLWEEEGFEIGSGRHCEGFHDRFHLGEQLGRGSFGVVHSATDKVTNEEYAVKIISKAPAAGSRPFILEKVNLEVDFLKRLSNCPHCLYLRGNYQDPKNLYIVTEWCRGGDLATLLKARGRLSEAETCRVISDVLTVLIECHSRRICYGDIKPANMLLMRPYPDINVKVADFGLCTFIDPPGIRVKKCKGTPTYMSPEVYMGHYGIECDLWSLGMMTYQLLSGKLPFWERDAACPSPFRVMVAVLNQQVKFDDPCWQGISDEAKDFVKRLLDRNTSTRLTARQALKHPWISLSTLQRSEGLVKSNVVELPSRRRPAGAVLADA